MHATGGERLYQWMGHAFVFPARLAGNRSASIQLGTKTPSDSAATAKLSLCFHLGSCFILYADEGQIILVCIPVLAVIRLGLKILYVN